MRDYYLDANIAINVYDISNKSSFLTLKKWVNEVKQKGPSNISITKYSQFLSIRDCRK